MRGGFNSEMLPTTKYHKKHRHIVYLRGLDPRHCLERLPYSVWVNLTHTADLQKLPILGDPMSNLASAT